MPLKPLPDYRDTVVVVGTSCRKPLEILAPHLASLDWQELPPRTRLHFVYVPDFVNGQESAAKRLFEFVNQRGGELIQGATPTQADFSDAAGLDSHQWSGSAMARVGHNKNLIIRRALELKADYLWLVDSDLILDRTSLASMLSCDQPIVTGVYWTKWSRTEVENRKVYAGPQVWLLNPYNLSGRGLDEAEFRTKLLSRGLVRVWGFGANTVFKRAVLEAGTSFEYLPDLSLQGLMGGEDRHLCARAERMHIPAFADCWSDCFHIYHAQDDIPKIPAMVERLGADRPSRARIGDLVSLRLRPLEPVPVSPTRLQQAQPQLVRGRLGTLELLPEIEEAVYELKRGERKVIRVHFPIHFEMPFLRGRMRLIEVTLLDVKAYSVPPNTEDDLYVGVSSGRWTQQLALTPDQHASLAEASA